MTINEILNLPKIKDSIDTIESFIETAYYLEEIKQAKFYLGDIYISLEMYNLANSIFLELINDVLYQKNVLSKLIYIYEKQKNATALIKLLEDYKKMLNINEWMFHLGVASYLNDELVEANNLFEELILNNLPTDLLLKAYQYLIRINLLIKEYTIVDMYLEKYIYLDNINGNLFKALSSMQQNQIKEVVNALKLVFIDLSKIDNDLLYEAIILNLKALILLKEYRYASVFEADYEELIEKASLNERKTFYELCINLYDILKNYYSKENYQKKLYKINLLNDGLVKSKRILKRNTDLISYKVLDQVNQFMTDISPLTSQTKIRDLLLLALNLAKKLVAFDEVIIYFKNDGYDGYHYKKERLFDKKDFLVTNTILENVSNAEILYTSIASLVGKKELITLENYENLDYKCVFIFPFKMINGGMIFYAKDYQMLKGHNYELIKFVSNIINDKLIDLSKIIENEKANHIYKETFNHLNLYLKYEIDDFIFVNQKLIDDFKMASSLNKVEFLSYLNYQDVNKYKEFMNLDEGDLRYGLKEKNIWEHKLKTSSGKLSILEDIDSLVLEEKKMDELIYTDHLTKLRNRYAFLNDVNEDIRNEKFSLLYLDIDNFKDLNDCYGHQYGNDILIKVGMIINDFFNLYQSKKYRIMSDEFLIILQNQNDVRKVLKIAEEFLNYLTFKINDNAKRNKITFSLGILRYKVQVIEKIPEKLLRYVDFAMYQAKKNHLRIAIFDREIYRKYLYEEQINTHLNEAIDNSKIGLLYQQVMNLDGYKVLHYEVSPQVLDLTIDQNEIMRIISLRGLTVKLEKYLLKKAFLEMKKLYDQTKKYLKISIPISYDTIIESDFISLVSELIKLYPKELLTLDLYGAYNDSKKVIDQLRDLGVLIITDDLINLLKFDNDYLKINFLTAYLDNEKGQKTLVYLLNLTRDLNVKLIVGNLIDKAQIEALYHLGVKYIHYGKKIFLEDIIKKLGGQNDQTK